MIFLEVPAVGNLGFDAILSEETSQEAVVTSNPVEFGADVSDHIYLNPKTFMLKGVVSDTVLGPVGNEASGDTFASGESRSKTAWGVLQDIQASGDVFDVQSNLERMTSMAIIRLTTTQDKSNSKALFFECMLRKVILVETELVALSSDQLAASAKNASATVEQGRKQKEPRASFFAQIKDGLANVLE